MKTNSVEIENAKMTMTKTQDDDDHYDVEETTARDRNEKNETKKSTYVKNVIYFDF